MIQAEQLRADPRVGHAKQALLAAVADHASELDGIRPPLAGRSTDYARLLDEAGVLRGRGLYFPYLGSGLGNGALVELADGSVKLDFISGIGVHVLGHSHPRLVEAALDAALGDTIMQGNLQMNADALGLSRALLEAANRRGARLAHCFLTTSGAMANENALKILFQKRHPASRVLAFRGCFAGRSLVMSRITDRPEYRRGLPDTVAVDYLPFFDAARPTQSTSEALACLLEHLEAHPDGHAAMIAELIQGEGGFYPGSKVFFHSLFGVLREHGVPILIDEIQSFGRTSELFAFQYFDLDDYADVVTVGKMTQVCATLFRAEFNPDPGLLSQTFTGGTAAIHGALAVLAELNDGDYLGPDGRIMRLGGSFAAQLEDIARRHPDLAAGPFGLGAMVGFTPLGGDPKKVGGFVRKLFDAGVMGFPAGKDPARVRFLIPYAAVSEPQIDEAARIIEQTLRSYV